MNREKLALVFHKQAGILIMREGGFIICSLLNVTGVRRHEGMGEGGFGVFSKDKQIANIYDVKEIEEK